VTMSSVEGSLGEIDIFMVGFPNSVGIS